MCKNEWIMRNADKKIDRIVLGDGRNFEYHNIDGFLTDNTSVFIEEVPQNKVKDVLNLISGMLSGFGFLYGAYSQLFEFHYKVCT